MQVRKFEAPTIKDAIELVKFHMGPDAIILSAKDNGKNFGLMGSSSVEVTAAVSEARLAQKRHAERKLDSRSKKKFESASARAQKDFIERAFDTTPEMPEATVAPSTEEIVSERVAPKPKRTGLTARRYIEIEEDDDDATKEVSASVVEKAPRATVAPPPAPTVSGPVAQDGHIALLKNEIQYLRRLLEKFQGVPQNFVTLHPGADEGLPYELSFAFKKLLDAGIGRQWVVEILKIANEVLSPEHRKKKALVDGWVIKYLLEHIRTVEKPFKSKYHVFVGPTGQGKTSTVVKIACHLVMKEKKRVAILSGDHVKIGAAEQLRVYAQILNVPCGSIHRPHDWVAAQNALENYDHILLDTPGVNLRSPQDHDTLRAILPPDMSAMDVHFVQSAMARDIDAFEVAERFKIVNFKDVIFTRLDEAVQHGLIYGFQKQFDVPIHSFGIGNAIPEDFEVATKERVVDLIFNLSKLRKERG